MQSTACVCVHNKTHLWQVFGYVMPLPGMWAARAHTRTGPRRSPGPCRHGCSCCSISPDLHPGHPLVIPMLSSGREWSWCAHDSITHLIYPPNTALLVSSKFYSALQLQCARNTSVCQRLPLPGPSLLKAFFAIVSCCMVQIVLDNFGALVFCLVWAKRLHHVLVYTVWQSRQNSYFLQV